MPEQTEVLNAALPHLPEPEARGLPHWVPVRLLGPQHRDDVHRHLLALDEADRVMRFGHLATDERIASYVEQIDFQRDLLFGIFDRKLRLVGLAHLAFELQSQGATAGGMAEFGVSVCAQSRGRGFGACLFESAVLHARNRGVRTLLIHMARENAAMLAIVRNAGARLSFAGNDALAELPLPADTLGSQLGELLGHQAAELDYRLKLQGLKAALPGQAG